MASIVEFACSLNSQIGNSATEKGVESIRLCKEICVLTTEEGPQFAFESLAGLSHPVQLRGLYLVLLGLNGMCTTNINLAVSLKKR